MGEKMYQTSSCITLQGRGRRGRRGRRSFVRRERHDSTEKPNLHSVVERELFRITL